jgi:hypothetical protein
MDIMERREFLQFVAAIPVAGLAFKAGAEEAEAEVEICDPIDITPDEVDRRWQKEGANEYFDRLIREGRKNELGMAFYLLAGRVIDIAKFKTIDRDDAIQECVFVAFEKLPRYQEASEQFLTGSQPKKYGKKPKAFNYFTTIMLCRIRQTYRSQRNHKDLRKKYEEYLS